MSDDLYLWPARPHQGGQIRQRRLRAQATQRFDHLKADLQEAGAGFEHAVKNTKYSTDMADLQNVFEVRDSTPS